MGTRDECMAIRNNGDLEEFHVVWFAVRRGWSVSGSLGVFVGMACAILWCTRPRIPLVSPIVRGEVEEGAVYC